MRRRIERESQASVEISQALLSVCESGRGENGSLERDRQKCRRVAERERRVDRKRVGANKQGGAEWDQEVARDRTIHERIISANQRVDGNSRRRGGEIVARRDYRSTSDRQKQNGEENGVWVEVVDQSVCRRLCFWGCRRTLPSA